MRRSSLLFAGIGLVAVVALGSFALPPVWSQRDPVALPRTVSEQAEWLGAFYSAGLDYHYGPYGLTPQETESAGGDLAQGLSKTLEEPLDPRQLSEVSAWLFRASASVRALDIRPPPLALKEHVGTVVDIVGRYASRPRLSHEEQDRIAGQVGAVLDELRQAMEEEFSEVPEAKWLVREAVYGRAAEFGTLIKAPVTPLIKRAYTQEEIDSLCASARELPAGQYQEYLSICAMPDPDDPILEEWRADAAKWTILGVSWLLRGKLGAVQYTPPVVLTPDEQATLRDYYSNTPGALENSPEAMEARAQEVLW